MRFSMVDWPLFEVQSKIVGLGYDSYLGTATLKQPLLVLYRSSISSEAVARSEVCSEKRRISNAV